jgi:phosphoribosylformylglycinamidine synthase
MYKAIVAITLRPSILDPEGKTVHHALNNLGYDAISQVRMGKRAELWIDADTEEAAREVAEAACEKLLANPVTENFEITLEAAEEAPEAAEVKTTEDAASGESTDGPVPTTTT